MPTSAATVPPVATPVQVASSDARTGASGQPTSIGFSLTVPIIQSGTYNGSLPFVATPK